MNTVQLIGRLGNDPEMKTTSNGKEYATFSLATSEYFKDGNGERQQKTQWHNVIVWSGLCNIIKFFSKGSEIGLNGKIEYLQWEKEGEKKYMTQIVAEKLHFVGTKKENNNQSNDSFDDPFDNDLPY